jgi:hypothetical protein
MRSKPSSSCARLALPLLIAALALGSCRGATPAAAADETTADENATEAPPPPPPREAPMTAPPLHKIRQPNAGLTDEAFIEWLATFTNAKMPIKIEMDGNKLTVKSVQAIADSGLEYLEYLSLSGNPIGDEGLSLIATTEFFAGVYHLGLANTGVTAKGAAVVIGPNSVYGLNSLDLSHNALGDDGVIALFESPYTSYMEGLTLNDVGATDKAAAAIASHEHAKSVTYMELMGNSFSDEAKAAIRANPHLAQCHVEFGD